MSDKEGDDKAQANDEPDADVGGFGLDTDDAGDGHTLAVHEFLRKSRDDGIRKSYNEMLEWTLKLTDFRIENTCDVEFDPFVVVRLENRLAEAPCGQTMAYCCAAESSTELLTKFEMTAVHPKLDSGCDVLLPSVLTFKSWPHVSGCGLRAANPNCAANPLVMSYADLLQYRMVVELWHHQNWMPNLLLGYRSFELRTVVATDPIQGFEVPNRGTLPGAKALSLARVSFRSVLETRKLEHHVRASRFSMSLSHTIIDGIAMGGGATPTTVSSAAKTPPGVVVAGADAARVEVEIKSHGGKTGKPQSIFKAAPITEDAVRGHVVDAISHVDLGPKAPPGCLRAPKGEASSVLQYNCSRSALEAQFLDVAVSVFVQSACCGSSREAVRGVARLPLAGITSAGVLPVTAFVVFKPKQLDARGIIPSARFRMIERARSRLHEAYMAQEAEDTARAAAKSKVGMADELPPRLPYVAIPMTLRGRTVGAYIRGFLEWRPVNNRLIQLFSQPSASGGSDIVVGQPGRSDDTGAGDSKAASMAEDAAIGERGETPAGPLAGDLALTVDDAGATVGAERVDVRETARVPMRTLGSKVGFAKDAGFGKSPRLAVQVLRLRLVDKQPASQVGSTGMRVLVSFAGSRQSTSSAGLDSSAAASFNHWSVFPLPPLPGDADVTFDSILSHTREPVLAALAPVRECVVEGWADSSADPFAGSEGVSHMVEPARRIVAARFMIPFHRLIPYIPSEVRAITQNRRRAEAAEKSIIGCLVCNPPSPDRILPAVAFDVPVFSPGKPRPVGVISVRMQLVGLQRPDPTATPRATKDTSAAVGPLTKRSMWVSLAPGLPLPMGVSFVSSMPTYWRERVEFSQGADERAAAAEEAAAAESEFGIRRNAARSAPSVVRRRARAEEIVEADGEAPPAAAGDEEEETVHILDRPETVAAMSASQVRGFPLSGSAVPAASHLDDLSTSVAGLRSLWASAIELTTDGLVSEEEARAAKEQSLRLLKAKEGIGELQLDVVPHANRLEGLFAHLRFTGAAMGPGRLVRKGGETSYGPDLSEYGIPDAVNPKWISDALPELPRTQHRSRAMPPWWRVMRDLWVEADVLSLRDGQFEQWLRGASDSTEMLQSLQPSELRFVLELRSRIVASGSATEGQAARSQQAILSQMGSNKMRLLRAKIAASSSKVLPGAGPGGATWLHSVHPLLVFFDEDCSPRLLTQSVVPIPLLMTSVTAACSLKGEFERILLLNNHSSLANSDSLRALDLLDEQLTTPGGFRTVHLRHRRHLAWRVARIVKALEFARPEELFSTAARNGRMRVESLATAVREDMARLAADPSYEARTSLADPDWSEAKRLDHTPLYRMPPRYVPAQLRRIMMQLPRVWMRLSTVMDYGRGGAAEHAALLCSLLLGIGEDAYVCIGMVRRSKPALDAPTAALITQHRKRSGTKPSDHADEQKAYEDISHRNYIDIPAADTILGPDAAIVLTRGGGASGAAAKAGGGGGESRDRDMAARDDAVAATEAEARDKSRKLYPVTPPARGMVGAPEAGASILEDEGSGEGVGVGGSGGAGAAAKASAGGAAVRRPEVTATPDKWVGDDYYAKRAIDLGIQDDDDEEEEQGSGQDAAATGSAAAQADAKVKATTRKLKSALRKRKAAAAAGEPQADSKGGAPAEGGAHDGRATEADPGEGETGGQDGDPLSLTDVVAALREEPEFLPERGCGVLYEGDEMSTGFVQSRRTSKAVAEIKKRQAAARASLAADDAEGAEDPGASDEDSSLDGDASEDEEGDPQEAEGGGVIDALGAIFGGWGAAAPPPKPRHRSRDTRTTPSGAAAAAAGDGDGDDDCDDDGQESGSEDIQRDGKPVAQGAGGEGAAGNAAAAGAAAAAAAGAGGGRRKRRGSDSDSVATQDLIDDDDRRAWKEEDESGFGKVPVLRPANRLLKGVKQTAGEAAAVEDEDDGHDGEAEGSSAATPNTADLVGFGIEEEECLGRDEEDVLAFWVVTYPSRRDVEGATASGEPAFPRDGSRHQRFLFSFRTGLEHTTMSSMAEEAKADAQAKHASDEDDGPASTLDYVGWKMSDQENPATFPEDGDMPPGATDTGKACFDGGAMASESKESLDTVVHDAVPDFWTPTGDVLPGRYQHGVCESLDDNNEARVASRLRRVVERLRYRRPMLMFNHKNIWVNRQVDCDERRKRWQLLRRALSINSAKVRVDEVTALAMMAAKEMGFPHYDDPDRVDQWLGMERPHEFMSRMQRNRFQSESGGAPAKPKATADGRPARFTMEQALKIIGKVKDRQAHVDDLGIDMRASAAVTVETNADSSASHLEKSSQDARVAAELAKAAKAKQMQLMAATNEYRYKFFTKRRDVASINAPSVAGLRSDPAGSLMQCGLLPSRCCDTSWDLRDRECWMPLLGARSHADERRAVGDIAGGYQPDLIRTGQDDLGRLKTANLKGTKDVHISAREAPSAGCASCFGLPAEARAGRAMRGFDLTQHAMHGRVVGATEGTAPGALVGPPLRRQLSLLETDRLTREIAGEVEGAIGGIRLGKRLAEGVVFDRRTYPVVRDTMRALLMSRALAMNFEPGSHDRRMADNLTGEVRKRVLELMAISDSRIKKAQKEAQSTGRVRGHIDAWVTRVQTPTDIRQLVQDTVPKTSPILSKTEAEILVEAFVESLTTGVIYTRFIAVTIYAE
ncbi:hypothetical protein FNF31_02533 [Cafeteria roenbergensis]|uniref:CEP76/DRC7 peptidase-like domain-containing protein n=1 Tax=Cafeteria roenbergensis TaxID=33653 RepID=A0A5A8DH87_CAFRO|nr:hypothetical protein FNF31_02533 [Cafeteria roenbergensis]